MAIRFDLHNKLSCWRYIRLCYWLRYRNPPQFTKVFYFENLIKNSIDATNPETGEIELSLINTDSETSIIFKDNGKGIKRKNWNDIFRPGFSTKKRGWGLGLSLTQRIVEDIHKGTIIVTDSSKDGTTIKITFNK